MRRTLLIILLVGGYLFGGSRLARAQAGPPAARVQIRGTVSDAGTKRPLPGVAVRLRRTRQGAVTNAAGDFRLTAAPADTLLFQALVYTPDRLLVPGASRSHRVVQVRLQRDSVRLPAVHVTADRLDRTGVNRALRNLKRPAPPPAKGPQRPKPKPLFAVDSTPPPPPPAGGGPLGLLYDKFSRAGKERRKMGQVKAQAAQHRAHQRAVDYNKVFKDNRGYE